MSEERQQLTVLHNLNGAIDKSTAGQRDLEGVTRPAPLRPLSDSGKTNLPRPRHQWRARQIRGYQGERADNEEGVTKSKKQGLHHRRVAQGESWPRRVCNRLWLRSRAQQEIRRRVLEHDGCMAPKTRSHEKLSRKLLEESSLLSFP